jgi:cytochrome c2
MIGGFHIGAAVLAGFVILTTASGFGQAPAPGSGKDLFERRCGGCHALDRDKEGPRLGGVYGRRAGSVDTFDYSEALKAANITWNDESLEKWLSDPSRWCPTRTWPSIWRELTNAARLLHSSSQTPASRLA